MFFVSGITGQVGGATARHLLAEGHAVRALARDPQKAAQWSEQGVDVRQGDFNSAADIATALEEVEGAFLMLPSLMIPSPGFPEAKGFIANFREALEKSPPPRLVVLSSVGSEQSSGLGNITSTHMMEQALDDLPFPTAFVRAGGFIENYGHNLEPAASTGWFDTFLTPADRPTPHVATEDIGREIARLLAAGWSGQKIVELGSRLSPDDIAQAMSQVLGRPIQARSIPRNAWVTTLQSMGFPPGKTGLWEEMQDGFNSGWIDFGVPGTQPATATTTAAQVFEQAQKARAAG